MFYYWSFVLYKNLYLMMSLNLILLISHEIRLISYEICNERPLARNGKPHVFNLLEMFICDTCIFSTLVKIHSIIFCWFYLSWLPEEKGTSINYSSKFQTFQVMPEDESSLTKNLSTCKTIDENGGEIYLKGVKLSVPSGALTEPVTITVTIINNNHRSPSLSRKEALLSPLVECLPNGLQFKKTVLLTLPHCAHNIHEDWAKVNVSTRKTFLHT